MVLRVAASASAHMPLLLFKVLWLITEYKMYVFFSSLGYCRVYVQFFFPLSKKVLGCILGLDENARYVIATFTLLGDKLLYLNKIVVNCLRENLR